MNCNAPGQARWRVIAALKMV